MDATIDIPGLGSGEFAERARISIGPGSGLAPALYRQLWETGRFEPELLGASSASARQWRGQFDAGLLDVVRVDEEEGEFGPTSKALLSTRDGLRIECVHIPMPVREGRPVKSTLCVSSQAGCRMGCAFCETGRGGLARNLEAAEIVSQLLTTRTRLGWRPGNIVFMGMGEPLDNLPNVVQALHIFNDPRGPAIGWERMTLCTCAPPDGIPSLAALAPKRLNLSVSLNAGTDRTRSAIMPVNRRAGLSELREALAAYPRRRNFVLAANYCLIPGINNGDQEARGVADFCASVGRVLVNLIPYNPGSRPLAAPPTGEEIERFEARLLAYGCDVRRRARKGGAIMAACGQLGAAAGS